MDIQKLRTDTPGTQNVIHFNNAGASLMPRAVTEATVNFLEEELARGGYETARKHRDKLEQIYPNIAHFINAARDEIALLENATAAWNMAFFAIDFEGGDRILTSKSEYASNYISYLKLQQKVDVRIEVVPSDKFGQCSPQALAKMIDERVKLVSITHMPTNSGLVNPVEEIGDIVDGYPCLYLVDACQSVGHYPVDVQKMGCDMLSATGRKYLRGPRGTGFLYVSQEILETLVPPFLDLHAAEWTGQNEFNIRDDARRFENWEFNYAGIMGLHKAVGYADDIGIANIWQRIQKLAWHLREKLQEIPKVTVRDIGQTKGGIVTFTVADMRPQNIQEALSKKRINVSRSGKSSTLLDMEERNLESVVRASVHYYNTIGEIEKMVKILSEIS